MSCHHRMKLVTLDVLSSSNETCYTVPPVVIEWNLLHWASCRHRLYAKTNSLHVAHMNNELWKGVDAITFE